MIALINSKNDMLLAKAERDFVAQLNGSCLSPIAIYCREESGQVLVSAKVLSQNGDKQISKEIISNYDLIDKDIKDLSNEFISKGADKLILS
jgi:porphobilinogen deaminase